MITNKELNEVTLSTTKKDYYQIWNELMELAEKISERWSPVTTNESDPGIVLLKALTAVADKLNYNIDKNTLEAFMPSATQEESMRKLTEMMGYDMKHYRSATGKAIITYKSSNETPLSAFESGIYFPKFLNLKNEDEDINYVTLEEFTIQTGQDSREVAIIEGELLECETNNDNIITAFHLDDLNRYMLPEYAIAENGIFVTNIVDSTESALWRREQNLNVQQPGTKVYKVGFDSTHQLPYVQFPEDIKTLIEDGLRIKYIRTNGVNGNIAAKVLSKLEKPALWATADSDKIKNLSTDYFAITNSSAANNGADPESLNSAYNNYKKTIGTFDTLVTCRDYMNKIYQMTESDTDTTPLVSNIIVSDIRDDINKSTPVCTFNEYGVCYKDTSLTTPITITLDNGDTYTTTQNRIDHFDLVFYPFKTIYGLNNKAEYRNSFTYTAEHLEKIKADLALNKTISHNIITPKVGQDTDEIACIKNYLKLKGRVTTTKKVTLVEESEILNNIYKAIYTNFNARQLEFGEEIPYDTLVEVLKNADYRIKEINLDEPLLTTKFSLVSGNEEALSDVNHTSLLGNKLYNKLVRRNVLAGKIAAFKYADDFISEYNKTSYANIDPIYPVPETGPEKSTPKITSITSHFDVGTAFKDAGSQGLVLKENEVIQFRAPNFKTTKTYPAYVNYFLKLNSTEGSKDAIQATFKNLKHFMQEESEAGLNWNVFANSPEIKDRLQPQEVTISDTTTFTNAQNRHGAIFKIDASDNYQVVSQYEDEVKTYYYLPLTDDIFAAFNTWIKSQDSKQPSKASGEEGTYVKLLGIYRTIGVQEKPFGRLIDADLKKYLPAYKFGAVASNAEVLDNFYVQDTRAEDDPKVGSADGLGCDATYVGISKNGEYQLKDGEYLLINYTNSKTDESGTEQKTVINQIYDKDDEGNGIIIRANFELIDSALYHNNHSYSKKDGFSFSGRQPEGMFTLGINEQIELRSIVKVELNEPTMYLYWTLNSDDPNEASNIFNFTENYGSGTNNAYTLQEGEYLYYTNSKKQDLVYYGAGTLIVKNDPKLILRKYNTGKEISEEDIMTNGLAAEIPWQAYNLSGSKVLTIIENQYISLTEGDILVAIDKKPPETAEGGRTDWNNWNVIDYPLDTEYRLAEDNNNSHLPAIAVEGIKWSVRSRLDFNMSKTIAQPLNKGDKLVIAFDVIDPVVLVSEELDGGFTPMYINSNYTCQAATDTLTTTALHKNGLELKLKVSSQSTPAISDHEDLALNNYINGNTKYTKFDFTNLPATHNPETAAFRLNISIPETAGTFGLVALYYANNNAEKESEEAAVLVKDITNNATAGIEFFNTTELSTPQSKLLLKKGLNILKLSPAVKYLEFYADTNKQSTVIFGNLDIVTNVNPKLDYRLTDNEDDRIPEAEKATTILEQLLKDLKNSGVADDFYYNVPIQHANEIDLNGMVEEEKLSSPLVWYDPNNVNRKFVISEIDADYLSTGITLTKASRA